MLGTALSLVVGQACWRAPQQGACEPARQRCVPLSALVPPPLSAHLLVQVSSTPRTCLPQGPDLLAIGQILAAQTAAERSGAAMDGRLAAAVAGADLSSVLPPALPAAGSGRGRWAGVQRGTGGPGGSTSGAKGVLGYHRTALVDVLCVGISSKVVLAGLGRQNEVVCTLQISACMSLP